MAKTAVYWQQGEALDYENKTEEKILANTVIIFGNRIGVTGGDIAPGELGVIHMEGVFEIPKKSGEALKAGDNVVFTDEDGIAKATDTIMGYAVEAAAEEAATVKVKLLG